MGGDGGGRYTVRSKGWDILDFASDTLRWLERIHSLQDWPLITAEEIDDLKKKLALLQDQYKSAIDRERVK